LSGADSLLWIFDLKPGAAKSARRKTKQGDSAFTSVYSYDTVSRRWSARGGTWRDAVSGPLVYASAENGPHAPGTLVDNDPPAIQAFVGGREVLFLDYAAKDKPFNIFITDPSGVSTNSVRLLLNGLDLGNAMRSEVRAEKDGATVTVTAYPPPRNEIDSLTVIACDFAGNEAHRIFAYLPGEELSIRFLSCHPNPFSVAPVNNFFTLVRFAYLLTDVAGRVTLSVYTMTGRKIWSWTGSDLIGYQETPWNGLTSDGYRIANGTYYVKLVAKNNAKTAKKIIRVAKLEGY
jgi:hypothetical protein